MDMKDINKLKRLKDSAQVLVTDVCYGGDKEEFSVHQLPYAKTNQIFRERIFASEQSLNGKSWLVVHKGESSEFHQWHPNITLAVHETVRP